MLVVLDVTNIRISYVNMQIFVNVYTLCKSLHSVSKRYFLLLQNKIYLI